METKLCNTCKKYKPISEFSFRNTKTKNGFKQTPLTICKLCSSEKSKERYKKMKENHLNYIYRFVNKNKEIIYIGKTNLNLNIRINNHFLNGHLPKSCYDETDKIQFLVTASQALSDIKEIYYINLYKPKYNTTYRRNEPAIIIKDFQNDIWNDYDKEEINNLTKENIDYIHSSTPFKIISIFCRKRTINYLVYIEIEMSNMKRKQIKKGSFKNKSDAEKLIQELKVLYKLV